MYGEHGASISNELGQAIENGKKVSSYVPSKTYNPGDLIPNYTLHNIEDSMVAGTPYRVDEPTLMHRILGENMGDVDYAACLHDINALPDGSLLYDIDGIYKDGEMIKSYPRQDPLYRFVQDLWTKLFNR